MKHNAITGLLKNKAKETPKKKEAWPEGKDGYLGTAIKTFVSFNADGLCFL